MAIHGHGPAGMPLACPIWLSCQMVIRAIHGNGPAGELKLVQLINPDKL